MKMVDVKTDELVGPALDWAVAHAVKAWEFAHEWFPTMTLDPTFKGIADVSYNGCVSLIPSNPMRQGYEPFAPSTEWAQGGLLLDKYITALNQSGTETYWAHCEDHLGLGPTALVTTCRAIVAAKLGDVVSVPAELINGGGL